MLKGATEYLVMEQVVHGKVTPPEVRRPDLPPELSAIIMRALATDREDRYATADELRIALDEFAASTGLTASTSALAEYLRQQFGLRPEPWLELGDHAERDEAERDEVELSITHDELPPGHSWRESLRSSVPQSKNDVIRQSPSPVTSARPSLSAVHNTPHVPLARPLTRAALFAAPLVLLAGVGVLWFGGPKSPPAAARDVAETSLPQHGGAGESPVPSAAVAEARVPAAATLAEPAPAAAAPVRPVPDQTERRSAETTRPQRVTPSRRTAVSRGEQPTRAVKAAREIPAEPTSALPPASATMSGAAVAAVTASDRALAQELPVTAPAPEPKPQSAASPPSRAAPAGESPTAGPDAATARRVVTAAVFAANRTAGENEIMPDEATRTEMRHNGSVAAVGAYKICVGGDGKIDSVTVLKSTGYPAYDARIQSTIFTTWRYRPIIVDGRPGPVCSGAKISWSTSSPRLGNNPTWK